MTHVVADTQRPLSFTRRTMLRSAMAIGAASAMTLPRLGALAHQDAEYPEIAIVAKDFSFELPEQFEGGMVRLTFDNQGMMEHHAMLLRVNDDATVEAVQEALAGPDFGAVFAVATSIGGPMANPGLQASVIADVPAGSYVAICAIPGPDGLPHYMMGMQSVVEVTEPASSLAAPETDARVELMEMMFHGMAGEVEAGSHTWEVANVGEALHELALVQFAPGFTADQFMAMMMAEGEEPGGATPEGMDEASGPPPFTVIGGVAPMNPGYTNYLPLDLAAGDYLAICFVPDPETGLPHAAMGMVMPFSVA